MNVPKSRAWLIVGALLIVGCTALRATRDVERPGQPFGRSNGVVGGLTSREPTAPLTTANGILAGRVVDGFNREQAGAMIQVSATDRPDLLRDVQTDSAGYFVIQNLQMGRRYKLVTKTRDGKPAAGGTVFATPPNVVLLIQVQEPVEGGAAAATLGSLGTTEGKTKPGGGLIYEPQQERPPASTVPTPSPAPGPVRLGSPEQRLPPPPPRPEYLTQDDRLATHTPPPARIPGPSPFPESSPNPGQPAEDRAGSEVRLFMYPLMDLDGRSATLAAFRGKLLLLDFWGTWCPACIKGMPHLNRLHRDYCSLGLQVVGVTYEESLSPEQLQRVRFVVQRQGIAYPILLGAGPDCPLLRQFQVTKYPTLVLLDAQGSLLWRGEGLGDANVRRLEELIRARLTPNR